MYMCVYIEKDVWVMVDRYKSRWLLSRIIGYRKIYSTNFIHISSERFKECRKASSFEHSCSTSVGTYRCYQIATTQAMKIGTQ
jgi:hypothetical protein